MRLCGYETGNQEPFFLIAGPCVIESESQVLEIAHAVSALCQELGIHYIFKASYDKANRTSRDSFRGPGLDEGLQILQKVQSQVGVPVLTDVHEDTPIDEVASVVDVLQTPAFLARQTNFILRVAAAGKPVNIKKAQFMAPGDMNHVVAKAKSTGNEAIMVCDRGTSFGYNTLISDMRGLAQMRSTGCPVVFDATHSVQQPGGLGGCSGGDRAMVPVLARAAVAVGIAGLFIETHPDPDHAKSDGPNMVALKDLEGLLRVLQKVDAVVKAVGVMDEFKETACLQ